MSSGSPDHGRDFYTEATGPTALTQKYGLVVLLASQVSCLLEESFDNSQDRVHRVPENQSFKSFQAELFAPAAGDFEEPVADNRQHIPRLNRNGAALKIGGTKHVDGQFFHVTDIAMSPMSGCDQE